MPSKQAARAVECTHDGQCWLAMMLNWITRVMARGLINVHRPNAEPDSKKYGRDPITIKTVKMMLKKKNRV